MYVPYFDIHFFSRQVASVSVSVTAVCVPVLILLACNFEHETFPNIKFSFFQTLSWKKYNASGLSLWEVLAYETDLNNQHNEDDHSSE